MNNYTFEDEVWEQIRKSVQQEVITIVKSKKDLIDKYANEALSDESLKGWIKDFVNYDDDFRDVIREMCVDAITGRLTNIVDEIKELP